MQWISPGTTLTGLRENADRVDGLFQSMFLAGGLTLSQVASITGLEPGVYLIREIETLKGFTLTGEVIKVKLDGYYVIY